MSQADNRDAYLICELADSGRPEEQIAQMIASMFYEQPADTDELKMFARIMVRTANLIENTDEIWPGLTPGGLGPYDPEFELVERAHYAQLTAQLSRIKGRLMNDESISGADLIEDLKAELLDSKDHDVKVMVLNKDWPGTLSTIVCTLDARQRLYVLVNDPPPGQLVRAGLVITCRSSDLQPYDP